MTDSTPGNLQLRKVLMEKQAPFNQMRNILFHTARYFKSRKVQDIPARFRVIGANIAKTFHTFWQPPGGDLEEKIRETYSFIFNSKVTVERLGDGRIRVVDKKCRFCKYTYDDINHAGCELVLGIVAEFLNLEPVEVEESKTLGGKTCTHLYMEKSSNANLKPKKGGM